MAGRVREKNKERKRTKWWITFARYFGLQHKPSTGAKKKRIQIQDERYMYEIWKHSKQKMIGY